MAQTRKSILANRFVKFMPGESTCWIADQSFYQFSDKSFRSGLGEMQRVRIVPLVATSVPKQSLNLKNTHHLSWLTTKFRLSWLTTVPACARLASPVRYLCRRHLRPPNP